MSFKLDKKTVSGLKNKSFDFDDPIQRSAEQWDINKKRKLIDSILREYPIDPVRVIDKVEKVGESGRAKHTYIVIDGKQRLQTVLAFLNDGFALTSEISADFLDGKTEAKFSELSEEVKNKFNDYNLGFYEADDTITEEEKREIFERQNSGKPLTKAQMNSVKLSGETYTVLKDIVDSAGLDIYGIASNKAIDNAWHRLLSKTVFRNGEERNIVIATMMLIDNNYNVNFELGNEEIQAFIDKFNSKTFEDKETLKTKILKAADYMNWYLYTGGKISNLKKVSVPMLIAGMSYAIDNNKNIDKYVKNVRKYFADYKSHVEYQELVKASSNKEDNVRDRMEVFIGFAKEAGTAEEGVDYLDKMINTEKQKEADKIAEKEAARAEKQAEKEAAREAKRAEREAKRAERQAEKATNKKKTTRKRTSTKKSAAKESKETAEEVKTEEGNTVE